MNVSDPAKYGEKFIKMKQNCEILIIGGSAGSLEVILKFLPKLRTDLHFAVVLVLHRKSGRDSMLVDLLKTRTGLDVKEIEEKETIEPAKVYVVPPNYHLLIENNRTFSLDASEKVNFSRPSIDVTFESASEVYGENLVCLLLSGANQDGTDGVIKVKSSGGRVYAQNPASANAPYMPENAIEKCRVDEVLDPAQMAELINQL